MRNRYLIFLWLGACLSLVLVARFSHAQIPNLPQESVRSFRSEITIVSDASIKVSETIAYDFSLNERHGIYRDIPYKYKAKGGNFTLDIDNISVTDENFLNLPFERSISGNDIRIRIGDPNAFVTGPRTYVISYEVSKVINFFDAHDELYWNVTGDKWDVPMSKISASVRLPATDKNESVTIACYAGAYGSTAACSSADKLMSGSGMASVEFTQAVLPARENLTIVVGLPKGLVVKPPAWKFLLDTVKDNPLLLLPILVLVLLVSYWYKRGRDPKGRGTIITQFDAPDGLTPAEVGTIVDESTHKKDISAMIINLAVKGYLKIHRVDKDGIIFDSSEYFLEKLKDAAGIKDEHERLLMERLFKETIKTGTLKDVIKELNGGRDLFKNSGLNSLLASLAGGGKKPETANRLVMLRDLKDKFYKDLNDVMKSVNKGLVAKGYFPSNPVVVKSIFFGLGVFLLTGIWWAGPFIGVYGVISVVASALMTMAFAPFMPVKTKKGVLAKEHILGLKRYIKVAEKDRLEFHNAPDKNPEHFEKLLPYAMVLGLEKDWAKQFEGIYEQSPSWYSGGAGSHFSALALTGSLNAFAAQANTTFASRPSSASSGGSGFSGGGSGGGFGGGGGGSW